jgi:CO/xanthine dehydrogenase FAD-binding subunit
MAEALPFIGHVAIRNRGTIGGSLAHADAAGELPAVAVATEAEMILASARGTRTVLADDFFLGHFTTAMEVDECLVEMRIPIAPPAAGCAFMEVTRRHGDFALVGVAAMITLDASGSISDCRISLMGVASRPLRARTAEASLIGVRPSPESYAAAAQEAMTDLDPTSDVQGSASFRRHLASVTIRRALSTAVQRTGGR